MSDPSAPRLSKSRFMAGCQCHKLLWWSVHEPDAPELKPDVATQYRFDQGNEVGALARERFPGGVLIDLPHHDPRRVSATRDAIAAGAPAIFEATFIEDGVFVAVDVLLPDGDGWTLIEVKSSSSAKPEHVPDAAVQTYVVRKAGLDVTRVEIMHLNRDFRFPDQGDLFQRTDVTDAVEEFIPEVPARVAELRAVLAGPLPDVAIGPHCAAPRECAFVGRCWPDDRDHIRHLYSTGWKKTAEWMDNGVTRIAEIPPSAKLNVTQRRQRLAIEEDRLIVEPKLGHAIDVLREGRLGFLDFETVSRAVPVWNGLGPWASTLAQFSYHERADGGSYVHREYLADGPHDPRPDLAEELLEATRAADAILMYSSFERTHINALAEELPGYADDLHALAEKLVDLLPIVRSHVYHPDFQGSFSIKAVLNPLVPTLSYEDLAVDDGNLASVEIARLLFAPESVEDPAALRHALLAYCERDTWAMVKLLERLEELAAIPRS